MEGKNSANFEKSAIQLGYSFNSEKIIGIGFNIKKNAPTMSPEHKDFLSYN